MRDGLDEIQNDLVALSIGPQSVLEYKIAKAALDNV